MSTTSPSSSQLRRLSSLSSRPVYPITNTTMFMRTILALSLAAFALAAPLAQPGDSVPALDLGAVVDAAVGVDVAGVVGVAAEGTFCSSKHALFISLIDWMCS